MAEGALAHSPADLAVAVTGIAGPGGGTPTKPEGLVHFACARRGRGTAHVRVAVGAIGRTDVRQASVLKALEMLRAVAET